MSWEPVRRRNWSWGAESGYLRGAAGDVVVGPPEDGLPSAGAHQWAHEGYHGAFEGRVDLRGRVRLEVFAGVTRADR
jgi:hypothetical protein